MEALIAEIQIYEESAVSIVDYEDIILRLCKNVLQMKKEDLRKQ